MVPVPDYLYNNTHIVKQSKLWVQCSFSCNCGCTSFIPFVNTYTAEEQSAMKPYYDAIHYLSTGCWASTCTKDEDGSLHYWKLFTPAGLAGPKKEVFIPDKPYFFGISVVKIQCEHCGTEYLIFDSRQHGYDAITDIHPEDVMQYQPHFHPKCRTAVGIEIKVENDPSLAIFKENTGLEFDELQYSNAFSWIKIYAVTDSGKRRLIFDYETA